MEDAPASSPAGRSRTFYRRDLPHWQPGNRSIFVTTRLYGSIPAIELRNMMSDLELLEKEMISRNLPQDHRSLELARHRFAHLEGALNQAIRSTSAATWLRQPAIAGVVVRDAFYFWDNQRYKRQRYVIMPNHIHLVLRPLPMAKSDTSANRPQEWSLARIMQGLKGFTAREANRILGRQGPFREEENFDHWIGDEAEEERIRLYVDRNPVKAGL